MITKNNIYLKKYFFLDCGTEALHFVRESRETSTSTTSLDSSNHASKMDSNTFKEPIKNFLLPLKTLNDSTQTDLYLMEDWFNERINNIREKSKDKSVYNISKTDPEQESFTNSVYANNDDQFIMIPCHRSSICSSSGNEPYEKIIVEEQDLLETSSVIILRRSKSVENVNMDVQTEGYNHISKSRSRPASTISDKNSTEQNFPLLNTNLELLRATDAHTNLLEMGAFEKARPISSISENCIPMMQEKDNLKSIDDVDEGLELGEFYDEDMDSDRLSIETDAQTIIMVDMNTEKSSVNLTNEEGIVTSKQVDPGRAEAIRKLLTEPQRNNQSFFQRDVDSYRSYRTEKNKSDDLDYITDRHFNVTFI